MSTHELDLNGHFWIAAGALAAIAGGLLALGCDARDETPDVSAAAIGEAAREAEGTLSDTMRLQLADLEKEVADAELSAMREIDQAREKAEDLSVAARERLDAAIERAERARDDASDRLDELKDAGNARWDATRQKVVDALDELSAARRDVAAVLAGGEPSRSEG